MACDTQGAEQWLSGLFGGLDVQEKVRERKRDVTETKKDKREQPLNRRGLDWIFGKLSSWKGCPGQCWSPVPGGI